MIIFSANMIDEIRRSYTRGTPRVQFANIGRWSCVKASLIGLIVYVYASTHAWHVMPKVSIQVYMLDRKLLKLFNHAETGEKGQNVISSSLSNIRFLWFLQLHVSFIIPLPMWTWILLTKPIPIQKSVATVCLHCSFAGLQNIIGVLGTNVATK